MEEWDTSLFDDIDVGVHSLSHRDTTYVDFSTLLSRRININAIKHHSSNEVDPIALSKLWNIGLDAAKRTLQSTTQSYMQKLDGKISRRFKTHAHQRQYHQLGGYLSRFCY